MRKGRAATGNNPININLSELEKRILGIIGHEYVQGLTDVSDSFPEEHDVSKKFKIDYHFWIYFFYFVLAHYSFDCTK